MIAVLKEMATSKKAIAAIAGVLVALASKVGLHLDDQAVALIVAPIVSYILGQGWADSGKEAAKVTPPTGPAQ
jgi:uncharacterized membrane protein (DUF441 family)